MLLNRGTPLALVDVRYLMFAFAGSLLALGLWPRLSRTRQNILLVIDAAGLGLVPLVAC